MFRCLVYRIVEKSILVVFFSFLVFTTSCSLLYLNEKAIMRQKIERVDDTLSYSDNT